MAVTLAILGAGLRGRAYAGFAERNPDQVHVVAVADPRTDYRDALADRHAVAARHRFDDWRDVAAQPRLADAVAITTPDHEHVEPVIALAAQGYAILLEKPMALSEPDCAAIIDATEKAGTILAVCHVLRYTPYTAALKRMVAGGAVGTVIGVEHLEPVGWWHFAHSYVRGNWRRSVDTSSSLLAKCCHDLDWLQYIVDSLPTRVSSVGALHHFHPGNRPPNAADRCLDCPVERACPYSAKRLYQGFVGTPKRHVWPLSVLTQDITPAGVEAALRDGPYGRCVYASDNDVVDHQVVTVSFASGATATLTMSAFTPGGHRRTRVMGTHGYLEGDGEHITVTDFVTGEKSTVDTWADRRGGDADAGGGHGGGDDGVMEAFVAAVVGSDPASIRSGARESLDSHRMAFAAERSRLTGGIPVDLA